MLVLVLYKIDEKDKVILNEVEISMQNIHTHTVTSSLHFIFFARAMMESSWKALNNILSTSYVHILCVCLSWVCVLS